MRAQDAQWLSRNNHGNRYEGFIDRNNGLATYRVIDLLGESSKTPLGDPDDLHVLYFVPPNGGVRQFRVHERVDETQYLMMPINAPNSPNQWNLFEHWPVREVIVPHHVRPENLGVLIHLNDTLIPDLLAPAFLYGSTRPYTFDHYALHVYIEPSLSSLICTVQDKNGSLVNSNGDRYRCARTGGDRSTRSSSIVRIDVASSDLPPGLVTVHLTGRYANDVSGERFNNEVHFYHQPPPIPKK